MGDSKHFNFCTKKPSIFSNSALCLGFYANDLHTQVIPVYLLPDTQKTNLCLCLSDILFVLALRLKTEVNLTNVISIYSDYHSYTYF